MALTAWVLAIAAAALATPQAQAGDTGAAAAVGRWRTSEDAGIVEVARCGSGLCGHIVSSRRLKADPM